MSNELIILDNWEKAKKAIAMCKDIDEVKEIRDKAEALRAYAKQAKESLVVQNNICEIKLRAERRIGEFSLELPIQRGRVKMTSHNGESFKTDILKDAGIQHYERYEVIANLPEVDFERHIAEVKQSNEELTTIGVIKLARNLAAKENIEKIKAKGVALPKKKYACLVVDPPWPMKKIEREVRLNQAKLIDYPTMSEEELKEFGTVIDQLAGENCHLYLWTTHKFLPMALELVSFWGFNYQCLMTWVKNVGFTPFSWMYSTEHVLFCTKGSLPLLKKGERLDFNAKVREHSRKPDEFYEKVKLVSPFPRIDIFSTEKRDGFDQYGNEISKYNKYAN